MWILLQVYTPTMLRPQLGNRDLSCPSWLAVSNMTAPRYSVSFVEIINRVCFKNRFAVYAPSVLNECSCTDEVGMTGKRAPAHIRSAWAMAARRSERGRCRHRHRRPRKRLRWRRRQCATAQAARAAAPSPAAAAAAAGAAARPTGGRSRHPPREG